MARQATIYRSPHTQTNKHPPSFGPPTLPFVERFASALVFTAIANHIAVMISRDQWRALEQQPWMQSVEFAVGVLLIIASPIAGAIPGPGGIFVFAAGLALVLRTSMWAKRRYVHFKRWQPKAGRWADWGLRRQSAKRREAIAKERKLAESALETPESR